MERRGTARETTQPYKREDALTHAYREFPPGEALTRARAHEEMLKYSAAEKRGLVRLVPPITKRQSVTAFKGPILYVRLRA